MSKPKYLWAVDVFSPDREVQEVTLHTLEQLASARGALIEPVTVLSPDQLSLPVSAFERAGSHIRLEAESRMLAWLDRLRHERLVAPRFLAQPRLSLTSSVDTLLGYAREQGAELIGLGTTTRTSWKRFFLGSFTETLALRSELPLLVSNPTVVAAGNVKRVLFSTDFSEASGVALVKLLPTVKALAAELVIYTKSEFRLAEGVPAFGLAFNYLDYVELDERERKTAGLRCVDAARSVGVPASLVVDTRTATTSDSIVEAARTERADLIALAARSGPVASVVLGSVVRHVLRASPLPVWVIHP